MADNTYTRFKDISISERILNTVFLLTIGLGYLAALANMYYTHLSVYQMWFFLKNNNILIICQVFMMHAFIKMTFVVLLNVCHSFKNNFLSCLVLLDQSIVGYKLQINKVR